MEALQILNRCITFCLAATILLRLHMPFTLISLESLHFLSIHMFSHLISLPLLEAKANPLVRVILIIRLVFVILDLYEIRIDSIRVKRERNKRIDRRRLGNDLECP